MPRSPEAAKAAKRQRYADYKALCGQHQCQPDWSRWGQHFKELRDGPEDGFRRATRAELHAWWREAFTPDQIHKVGGGIG